MNARERFQKIANFQEADRIPISFGTAQDSIHRDGEKALFAYYGMEDGQLEIMDMAAQNVYPDKRLLKKFHSDTLQLFPNPPQGYELNIKKEGDYFTFLDPFGTKLHSPADGGLYYDFDTCVIQDLETDELGAWDMGYPTDPARFAGLREKTKNLFETTDKVLAIGGPTWGVFDQISVLRSLEVNYMDLAGDIRAVEIMARKITDFLLAYWPACLADVGEYVQVVQIGDDLGGESGPLFNPDTYRKVIKPCHKQVIDCLKAHTNAKVYYHGCGSMTEFIPDLIEIGVDILNPVQVQAKNMGSAFLKKEFGKDIVFWGGSVSPVTLSRGSVEEVVREAKQHIDDFKPGGGYIFASIHNIQPDASPEKVEALFRTAYEYGRYD